MSKRLGLRSKLIGGFVTVSLCFAIPTLWVYPQFHRYAYAAKDDKARALVHSAWGILAYFGAEAESGRLTREQAQRQALHAVSAVRYDGDNYLWINDLDCRMVMHPMKPELNGTSVAQHTDPDGVYPFQEFVRVARSQGEGRVSYLWPKPGKDRPASKVSYVKLYQPWGWVLGSGLYQDDIEAELRSVWLVLFGGLAASSALAVGLAWVMGASLANPLRRAADELASGASQLAAGANEVSASSQALAQGASEHAAALKDTADAGDRISSLAGHGAETAQAAAGLMEKTGVLVGETTAKLNEMTACMGEITASSGKISSIIKAIEEIAFQTNILALNAAVEAARAGEAGQGFAVVADEVRRLAARSAQAAKDTASLIEESILKSHTGGLKLEELAKVITAIRDATGKIGKLVEEVRHTSREQAEGVARVARSIDDMQQVTDRTAASSEEAAAASEQISAQAALVRGVAGQLEDLIAGSGAAEPLST